MLGFLKKEKSTDLIGISLQQNNICMVSLSDIHLEKPCINFATHKAYLSQKDQQQALQVLIQEQALTNPVCYTVLESENYQLINMQAPNLPDDELQQAMRWQIKSMIDYSPDDAVIDIFDMPNKYNNDDQKKMLYVVSAKKETIEERSNLINNNKLALQVIDIEELALRNICTLFPQHKTGMIYLNIEATHSTIIIVKEGLLYLARTLNFGLDSINNSMDINQSNNDSLNTIILEIQRSTDYYESHYGQAPCQNLLISPIKIHKPELIEYLSSILNINIMAFDINKVFTCNTAIADEEQSLYITAIGSLLRDYSQETEA
ncbi:MAG: pilus assembly protein PilM [Gammaproteobacteria bacterium]|nr:pilus assembly protein PilM [Gammaproteobacteria bacterium]